MDLKDKDVAGMARALRRVQGQGGWHHVIHYGLLTGHLEILKESSGPFLCWICFSPGDLFPPYQGVSSYHLLRAHMRAHTHTHGTNSMGEEKARIDIFFLTRGLNT